MFQEQRQQQKNRRGGAPEEEDNVVQKWKQRGEREAPPGPRCYISSPLSGSGQRGWRERSQRHRGGGGEGRFNNLWWEEVACERGNALNDDNREEDAEAEMETETECSLRMNIYVVKVHQKKTDGAHSLDSHLPGHNRLYLPLLCTFLPFFRVGTCGCFEKAA